MEKIMKPQQSSKNTRHQITEERALERRERQEGIFGINGRKLRHSSDQTTAFSCPSSDTTRAQHREQCWPGAKGGTGVDTQPTGLPTLPSQPDPLFSFSPPERHTLPLRGKPHPNIPLPALSRNDSPFRKQFLLVWNIMGLLPLRVFLESLNKISLAAQLCQKGKGEKKFLALSPQAPNGTFAKTGSIEKKC